MVEAGRNESIALSLYYRIIVTPAQLTYYDIGGKEIKSLRKMAKERLGSHFDIKDFQTKI